MPVTKYSRRTAYDNVAVGSAVSSLECTLPDASGVKAGVVPPTKDCITFAHGERLTGSATAGGIERTISGAAAATGERPGGA